ncbi:MAG TPA: DNA polymerase III subunit gamma/tau [Planctomycetota bacterium]|jgi:DNA polymerase-3 subunit gamma/tau
MAAKRATKAADKPPEKESQEPVAAPAAAAPASYVVFARRFRPRGFGEVVGQTACTSALRQALSSGRLAQAYLFCGPRGVGKTSLARIVAKALNCLNGKGPGGVSDEPCNACPACDSIHEGSSLDVIEMDAATNRGIEEIRSLRDNVAIAPAELRYKVYIIDEVHMLTREAWNAFLKTLEEPPAHVKFIFATTDPNHVPETILSRCQRYDLRRIGPADIVTRLKQICQLDNIQFDESALSRIAGLARGGLRDAESILDQGVNLGHGKITDEIVRQLGGAAPDELITEVLKGCAQGQAGEVLVKTHQALEAGADPEDMLNSLLERMRGTLLAKVCGPDSPLLEGHAHLKAAYAELGQTLSEDQCLMLLQVFSAARRQMKDAAQTRLPLEMALLRAARARDLTDLGKLVSALETPGPIPRPPNAEGPRPNSQGRQAATVERPAALHTNRQDAGTGGRGDGGTSAASSHAPSGALSGVSVEQWGQVIAAAAARKGGSLLASALSHAKSVAVDLNAKTVALGFSPDQLFYKESLEKPANEAAVAEILAQVFGAAMKVRIERASAAAVARVPAVAAPRIAPPASRPAVPAPSKPAPTASTQPELSQDDFEPVDGLALESAEIELSAEDVAAPVLDDEDAPPRPTRPAVVAPARKAPLPPVSAEDAKALSQHPAVKLAVQQLDGAIVSVRRK